MALLDGILDTVNATTDSLLETTDDTLDTVIGIVNDTFNGTVDDTDGTVNDALNILIGTVNDTLNTLIDIINDILNDTVDGTDGTVNGTLNTLIDTVNNKLNTLIVIVNDKLNTLAGIANDPLNGTIDGTDDTVNDQLNALVDTVNDKLNTLIGTVNEKLNTLVGTVNDPADGTDGTVNDQLNTLVDTVNDKLNTLVAELVKFIDETNSLVDSTVSNDLDKILNNFIDETDDGDFDADSGSGRSGGSSNDLIESGAFHKLFSFDITDNKVVTIYEVIDGIKHPLSFEPNEINHLAGRDIILGKDTPFGVEITRFQDKNSDGLYIRSFEQSVVSTDFQGSKPHFTDVLRYSPTEGDDLIAVRSGEFSTGGSGNDKWVVKGTGDLIISDLEAGEKIYIDTVLGLRDIEHLKSFVTSEEFVDDDFVVTFGEHASITLIDVNPDLLSWDIVQVWS